MFDCILRTVRSEWCDKYCCYWCRSVGFTSVLVINLLSTASTLRYKNKTLFISKLNPFFSNASFLYSLKTENLMVSWCFQRVEKGCIGNKWVNIRTKVVQLTHASKYGQYNESKVCVSKKLVLSRYLKIQA